MEQKLQYVDYIKLLNDFLQREAKEKEEKYNKIREAHWPSTSSIRKLDGEIIGSCNLFVYRQWNKIPPTNPYGADSLQKFKWGDLFHEFVTRILEAQCLSGNPMVRSVEKKVKVTTKFSELKYPVSLEIDNVVNKLEMLENKSSFGKSFFGDNGVLKIGPKESWLIQTLIYLRARPDLPKGTIFFIARDIGFQVQCDVFRKDDGLIVEQRVNTELGTVKKFEYPHITMKAIIERWKELESYIEKKEEPPMDFKFRSKWPCSGCLYFDMCFPEHKKAKTPAMFDVGQNEG